MISVTVGARSRSCSGPKPKMMSFRSFFSVRRIMYFRNSWCRCGRTRWKMSLKPLSTRWTCWLTSRHWARFSRSRRNFKQPVQLGLALRHERGRQVELVGGQHGQVEILVAAGLHDDLVDQVVAERQAGDLLDQRLVLGAEDVHLAADVLDVVFQEQDALRVAAVAGFELVQIEPLQQLPVDLQLQVGHDRAEVGLQLVAADGGRLLGLEGERVGPDADLGAGVEQPVCPPSTSSSPTTQLFRPTFSSSSLPSRIGAHHGMLPRDQRALQADRVGRVAADGDPGSPASTTCGGSR